MTRPTPTREPTEVFAGSSWSWDVAFSDFRSDEGWTLAYYLRGPVDKVFAAGTEVTADGVGGFSVRVPKATTDDLTTSGAYRLIGRVFKTSDEFDGHIVYNGHLLVLADPTRTVNAKSFNRQRLEALQAAVLTMGADGLLYREQSINGRRVVIDADAYERELAQVSALVAIEENPNGVLSSAVEFING